ncbi:cytochrome P450 [Gordonia rhizosphera]|uniref:Bifunctional cytochrome P450/NADPH--P450 reductase n=1 Tax=Gordonia rhizosphera NBRC 16068 TaxID=1108045 RepID=K6VVE3_9ACTN|nr:cytochrome P450 [Gordonia rhizosphera]GAB90835.1 putative cytochrome P450/NADPH--cytochrome P450 reductase [Gordonia rhizosphera NBRC 16068]
MASIPDFLDPSIYSDGIPHAQLAERRDQAPVQWVDEPASGSFEGGPGYWLVLSYDLVSQVSRNPGDFSSWRGTAFLREQRPTDVKVLRRMMLHMDPPQHTQLRKIVNKAFTPMAIRKTLADSITRVAREVVNTVCERGSADLLGEVAAEMPLLILAELLGVPAEDRHLLYSWTNALVGIDDPEYGGDPQVFLKAFAEMFEYARAQTAAKRANPTNDVWSTVVNAEVDGERLSDDDLDRFFQLLMIAGNETTRNLIAGGLNMLFTHPDQFDRLRADMSLLPSAIEEMLRFNPSVIQFRRTATRDMEFGGVQIRENDRVIINYASANRDPSVFENPDVFDIGRDPNPHISFGDGTHFCLGANLARLQVRTLLTELLTRLPDIRADGEPERMRSNFINGIKRMPVAFTPAERRDAEQSETTEPEPVSTGSNVAAPEPAAETTAPTHQTPLHIFFGSNFGTAEETAQIVADEAKRRGFAPMLADLDDAIDGLRTDGATIVVTATYNGTPPDNAGGFAAAIAAGDVDATGVKFSVFGCGNSEWDKTFQHFPRTVDAGLDAAGGIRVRDRGEGDAAGDFDESFEAWLESLWPALADAVGLSPDDLSAGSKQNRFRMEVVSRTRPGPFAAARGAVPLRLTASADLTRPIDGLPIKTVRHIEFRLPEGTTYAAGDHLGVIPHNDSDLIARVTDRFGVDPETIVVLRADDAESTFLPVGERISIGELLRDYVELQGTASRRQVEAMLDHSRYPWTREALSALLASPEVFRTDVVERRKSLLDLLEEHPACELPFETYLDSLGPLAPRYYSISSSPHHRPGVCSITVGVLAEPARNGSGRDHLGVCSNFLAGKQSGDDVYAFVRDTSSTFRLPADPSVPVIMIGAGTGLAPFRGFLTERATQAADGVALGEALVIAGARHPRADLLYAEEFRAFDKAGIARIEHAFSRVPGAPRVYVQDRVTDMVDEILDRLDAGAHVYLCGANAMADGVANALIAAHQTRHGVEADVAQKWFADLSASPRYHVDVWAVG